MSANSSPPIRATQSPCRATDAAATATGLQHGVPGRMALLVVHALEVVEVDQDERVGLAGRRGALERQVEAAPVATPVSGSSSAMRALVQLGAHQAALQELDGDRRASHREREHHEAGGVAHVERRASS